jgi:hypothetical protein
VTQGIETINSALAEIGRQVSPAGGRSATQCAEERFLAWQQWEIRRVGGARILFLTPMQS